MVRVRNPDRLAARPESPTFMMLSLKSAISGQPSRNSEPNRFGPPLKRPEEILAVRCGTLAEAERRWTSRFDRW